MDRNRIRRVRGHYAADEETMHIADAICECRPRLSQFHDGRRLLIHKTFDGAEGFERFERGLIEFYQVRMAA